MRRVEFLCTLESDVVVHADSNTEGNIPLHDYIPGSNFLGVVAREYDEFGDKAFDIFHSGKVRFCDAHPLIDGKRALRPPLSWFSKKGRDVEDGIYNQLKMDEEDMKSLVARNIQLKQLRSGFFVGDGYASLVHSYSQKSAYDSEKRRSEEGAMYGYSAIASGMEFAFAVEFDSAIDDETIERVCTLLTGKKSVGKSKSAQYGMVRIERAQGLYPEIERVSEKGTMLIYAQSRLAFFDENGNGTLQPSAGELKLPEGAKIDWAKSQIRSSTFTPYNGARRTRDYQRFVIEKGSVIVVDGLSDDFDSAEWLDSVGGTLGGYRSEGFGEVLVDPDFLESREPILRKSGFRMQEIVRDGEDDTLLRWIEKERKKKERELDLIAEVRSFIKEHGDDYRATTPSQWGAIRAFARKGYEENELKEYLEKGKASKEQWSSRRKETLFTAIRNSNESEAFLRLLASEMAKYINRRGGEK